MRFLLRLPLRHYFARLRRCMFMPPLLLTRRLRCATLITLFATLRRAAITPDTDTPFTPRQHRYTDKPLQDADAFGVAGYILLLRMLMPYVFMIRRRAHAAVTPCYATLMFSRYVVTLRCRYSMIRRR